MKRLLLGLVLCLLVFSLVGCGTENDPNLIPVTGKVTLDGKPLSGAHITFTPVGSTPGQGAFGQTEVGGTYDLMNHQGKKGVPAGEYKVTISKRLMPDGSDVPADDPVAPADSPARESLPPHYSDFERTTLTKTVAPGGGTIDFPLQRK